jgi:ribosomal protein S27AE
VSEPKPYTRQHISCPNCDIGVIMVVQDGEDRYGKCLCAAGENYKGMPTVSGVQYPFKSDGKMVASGEVVDNGFDF